MEKSPMAEKMFIGNPEFKGYDVEIRQNGTQNGKKEKLYF